VDLLAAPEASLKAAREPGGSPTSRSRGQRTAAPGARARAGRGSGKAKAARAPDPSEAQREENRRRAGHVGERLNSLSGVDAMESGINLERGVPALERSSQQKYSRVGRLSATWLGLSQPRAGILPIRAVGWPFAGGPTGPTWHEKVGCYVKRCVAPLLGGLSRGQSAALGPLLVPVPHIPASPVRIVPALKSGGGSWRGQLCACRASQGPNRTVG
jgi:hypothetical protein